MPVLRSSRTIAAWEDGYRACERKSWPLLLLSYMFHVLTGW